MCTMRVWSLFAIGLAAAAPSPAATQVAPRYGGLRGLCEERLAEGVYAFIAPDRH